LLQALSAYLRNGGGIEGTDPTMAILDLTGFLALEKLSLTRIMLIVKYGHAVADVPTGLLWH
jgi:hypothetical protein